MIDLYNADTNEKLGSITEADLQVLIDGLEEESDEDQDYFIDEATIDLLGDGRATEHLLDLLPRAVGSSDGLATRWERRCRAGSRPLLEARRPTRGSERGAARSRA